MAESCWSKASPHWMAPGLALAYRRADARMASASRSQISAAHSGVVSLTDAANSSKPAHQAAT